MAEFTIRAVFREWAGLLKTLMSPLLGLALILLGGPALLRIVFAPPASTTSDVIFASGILFWVCWNYFYVATVWMAGEAAQGRRPAVGAALGAAAPRFFPTLLIQIMVGIGVGIGSLLLIVPGVIIACAWSVAAPVAVLERPGISASLKRSVALTRGYRWRVFGINLVMFAGVFACGFAIGLLALLTTINPGTRNAPSIIIDVFSALAFSTISAATYITLRRAKEGSFAGDVAAVFD